MIPNEFASLVVEWFRREGRLLPWREGRNPYRIWISEVMLQQTRIEAVIPYFERALELEPGEKNTLTTLKELYYRLREKPNTDYMKKYEKTKEMLESL